MERVFRGWELVLHVRWEHGLFAARSAEPRGHSRSLDGRSFPGGSRAAVESGLYRDDRRVRVRVPARGVGSLFGHCSLDLHVGDGYRLFTAGHPGSGGERRELDGEFRRGPASAARIAGLYADGPRLRRELLCGGLERVQCDVRRRLPDTECGAEWLHGKRAECSVAGRRPELHGRVVYL